MNKLTEKEKTKLLEILNRIANEAISCLEDCMDTHEKILYARWRGDEEMYNAYLKGQK
jgi:hypothetical protein